MENKSCANCRTCPPQWECTKERVEKQKMMASDCVQWSPDYNTIESQLSAAHQEIAGYREALKNLVDSIEGLISESYGVDGLHLNGDVAPWDSLTAGGQFEEWLLPLEDARQALSHPAPVDEEKEVLKNTVEQMAREFVGSGCCPLDFSDSKYGECSPLCREIWDEDTVMNCIIDYFTNQACSRIEGEK